MFFSKINYFFRNFFSFKRKKNLFLLGLMIFTWGINFYLSPYGLDFLQRSLRTKIVFFSVTEPLVAMLKFSFLLTFLLFFPFLWYTFFNLLNFLFSLDLSFHKKSWLLFFLLGILLFYLGIFFAYKISLPYGIQFFLSFKTEKLEPAISLEHLVSFFGFFLLAFGLLFELPLIICFLSFCQLLNPYKISSYRKEIFFVIIVFSAIITPTPDALNMMLLALPLYLLFELGLFLSKSLVRK